MINDRRPLRFARVVEIDLSTYLPTYLPRQGQGQERGQGRYSVSLSLSDTKAQRAESREQRPMLQSNNEI